MACSPSSKEYEPAQARAAVYGLIAHGFQYPDAETVSTLVAPERWENWPGALHNADKNTRASLQFFRDAARAFSDASEEAHRELRQRYDSLFGHAVHGRCPAYEMEYGRNEIIRQASDLADLAGFYGAFGLEVANDGNGRPDHITAECEFMSAVCSREAHAHIRGDKTNADICLDAERTFLRDHLARWLPSLAHRLKAADPDGLFGALARFADAFVTAECSYFDIHAGPPTLELRPPDPVLDRAISCGPVGCGEDRSDEQFVQLGLGMERGKKR